MSRRVLFLAWAPTITSFLPYSPCLLLLSPALALSPNTGAFSAALTAAWDGLPQWHCNPQLQGPQIKSHRHTEVPSWWPQSPSGNKANLVQKKCPSPEPLIWVPSPWFLLAGLIRLHNSGFGWAKVRNEPLLEPLPLALSQHNLQHCSHTSVFCSSLFSLHHR